MAMDEGYGAVKMMMKKRKELDDINDNFSDFSLSSPATKIRRLDAELPPIMEVEETDIPLVFSQSKENPGGVSSVVIEELGIPDDINEERAIVLFNPINNSPSLVHSPSSYSFSVSPKFMSGFKNQALWSSQLNLLKAADDKTEKQEDEKLGSNNGCLAVVPWVPRDSQPSPTMEEVVPQMDVCEMMEADEPEVATMEIEDNGSSFDPRPGHEFEGMGLSEGLNQWQQHCLIPQPPPQNLSTPVTWFR